MAASTNQIIRLIDTHLTMQSATEDAAVVDDILNWFDRIDDIGALRAKMKERFAVAITKGEDGDDIYTRGQMSSAIDAGLYEAVSTGIGPRIAAALATLFTSGTQSWSYDNDEAAEELIAKHRASGGFQIEMSNCDFLSVACESAVMHIGYANGNVTYSAIGPHLVNFVFPASVQDNGQQRLASTEDLEDAAAVIIQTSTSGPGGDQSTNTYRAYFGESDLWPKGRMCDYTATQWENFPDGVNSSNVVYEYTDASGEPANPMTLYKQSVSSDEAVPEYPIAIIRGGTIRSSRDLLPVSTSLYEASLELELAWSRIIKDGLEGASGKYFIENPNNAPLPIPVTNWFALNQGQTVQLLNPGSGDAQSMVEIIREAVVAVAGGHSVPDYQVVSVAGGQDTSGVALAIKTQPLMDRRAHRQRINAQAVDRVFRIERGLINTLSNDQISDQIVQEWNPGELSPPRNETEFLTNLETAQRQGLLSYIDSVRIYHGLPTDEAAVDKADEIAESNTENPAPSQSAPSAPVVPGLPPRNLAR